MESFRWDTQFETGLGEIDAQHRRLVALINTLARGAADDHKEAQRVMISLGQYAQHHFSEEETLMREVGVDPRLLDGHTAAHRAFIFEVSILQEQLLSKEGASDRVAFQRDLQRLSSFLIHWLGYHILGADQKMARQVAAVKSGRAPHEVFEEEERHAILTTEPLVKTLDGLFQLVSLRNRELSELNANLERRILERTEALRSANTQLESMALTDALTGLPNRRFMLRHLQACWHEVTTETPLSCIMIDADHFKEVNDTQGHGAGDAVLTSLARILRHSLRTDDVVGRLGGDEFLVVCHRTDEAGALHLAETLRTEVQQLQVAIGSFSWKGSISMGVATRDRDHRSCEDLIRAADHALYAAKRAGKNCVRSHGVAA